MKIIIMTLSLPFIFISLILFNKRSVASDYKLCINYIENNIIELSKIDDSYLKILILAEDHRNPIHLGIDPIAILRCIYIKIKTGQRQGGSTIEQQLVRTLTNRYERTLRRKIREQAISIMLKFSIKDKKTIGKAYLHCAYFGYMKKGFFNLKHDELIDKSELIARLKYPTKKNESPNENKKIQRRKKHINSLLSPCDQNHQGSEVY